MFISHHQCVRTPLPAPSPARLVTVFVITVILPGVRWNLSVVSICFSTVVEDTIHIFKYFLPSSFENRPFSQDLVLLAFNVFVVICRF